MLNAFAQINEFLNSFPDEVQGRDAMRPDPQLCDRLERLARGQCSEPERVELCQMLVSHPEWMSYLADSIKQLRRSSLPYSS
jgi:hypothetical protein